MIEIPFLFAELAFAAAWLLLRFCVWMKNRRIDWKREAVLLLMYVNLAVILRFSFFPLSRLDGKVQPLLFDPERVFPLRVNLVPFVMLLDYDSKRELLANLLGNFCMFIPSGIVFPIVYRKLDSFWKTAGAGVLLSLCIEILQLPFFQRTTDIDDLILNTAGVMVGCGICSLVRKAAKRRGQLPTRN